jgi:hypothetical protein
LDPPDYADIPIPEEVIPVSGFRDDVFALKELLSSKEPPLVTVRTNSVYEVVYGFGDASGKGFGSMMLSSRGIKYRIGLWGADDEDESSNWKEFENQVEALEQEAANGNLANSMVFFYTDNYQIEMIGKGLGAKPAGLAEDVMAPTAWATIATVADKLLLVQKGSLQRNNVETMINESKQKLIQYIEVLLNQQKRSIDSDVANGNSGIKTLQVFVKESTLRLNEKLDVEVQDLHAKLENLGKRPRSDDPTKEGPKLKRQAGRTPTGAHEAGDRRTERPDWASEVISTFEGRVNGLENKVQKISADSDETAIKFAGLGFRSQKETAAWCEIAIPHHNCGLIVDAHMVLEHVNAAIEGQETIHRLEKLSRLKIKTIADGLAMTSFETKLPRYFLHLALIKFSGQMLLISTSCPTTKIGIPLPLVSVID